MVKSMRAALSSLLWRPIRRLVNDRRAVSAVEFALVLPVMLTIYIGGNQVSQALTAAREVDHVASTVGDLVAQSKTLSNSDMTNILNAAASVMAPFPTSLLRIKVSGITFDASTVAKVTWADQFQDTALTVGSTVTSTIPTALQLPSTFLVIAEVHYSYTPYMGYVLTGTFDLTQKLYFYPRDSSTIARTS
jgi:Flp pilus assembly protein TadG